MKYKFLLLLLFPILSVAQTTNVVRINSGGGAQNYSGQVWVQDQYFTGGSTYSTTAAIGNTVQDQIYQTERFGNFTYKIPVVAGKYKVSLHIAEIYWTATGQRTFSISVENQFSQTNVDLFASYGANNSGVIVADNIVVNDGFLDVVITTQIDNGKLSGIGVDKYDVILPPDPPSDTTDCNCKDGISPSISVGTTTTLPPGSPATVTGVNSGNNTILSFGIPQGIQGPPGSATGGGSKIQNTFNVWDYGARYDGSDATTSIQNAINDAMVVDGKVIIPSAPVGTGYKTTRTLRIEPADGQTFIDIESWGHHGWQIDYYGPSNEPAVQIIGLKGGVIQGLKVRLMSGISNSACFEIGTRVGGESTSGFSFINCDAELGNGINNVGWRMGKVNGGPDDIADISQIQWSSCSAWGGGQGQPNEFIPGQIGWDNVGSNSLQLTWTGGGGIFCDKLVRCQAGGSMFFYSFGGGHNNISFLLNSNNNFGIYGGRFEVGKTFVKSENADGGFSLHVSVVELGDFIPPNGRVFDIDRAASVLIDGLRMEGGNTKGAQTFYLGGYQGVGSLQIRGGSYHNVGEPFYTVNTPGKWSVRITDVGKRNSIHYSDSFYTNKP